MDQLFTVTFTQFSVKTDEEMRKSTSYEVKVFLRMSAEPKSDI